MHKIAVGDVIRYEPFGGGARTVRVTAVYDDIKNGRPGFDGTYNLDHVVSVAVGEVWGYTAQIIDVVSSRVRVLA